MLTGPCSQPGRVDREHRGRKRTALRLRGGEQRCSAAIFLLLSATPRGPGVLLSSPLLPKLPVALHGQDEAAAVSARLTTPLVQAAGGRAAPCPGRGRSLPPPRSAEQNPALGWVSWLVPGVLYCPAQMSGERIKPRAEGGRRILCSGDLAQEQSCSRFRHGGRGISGTCLGRLAPVSHHLTHSRRQSLAQQPGRLGIYGQQVMHPSPAEGSSSWKTSPGQRGAGLQAASRLRSSQAAAREAERHEGFLHKVTKLLHV